MPGQVERDLKPVAVEGLSWGAGSIETSLGAVFDRVDKVASGAVDWYHRSKRAKQRWAMMLRVGAILGGAAAGMIPLLTQLITWNGQPVIPAGWASVALGLAAALVLLDRFFGFSSGWMRYIDAATRLTALTEAFRLDWDAMKAGWRGAEPNAEQVQSAFALLKAWATQVQTIIRQETDGWMREFQSVLQQIEEGAQAKSATSAAGAINVTVTNGDLSPDGWSLTVDGGDSSPHYGKTAGLRGLVPGSHTLRTEGRIDGQLKQAEVVAPVAAGETASVQMTLS